MNKEVITLELAKLAKEKGFDIETPNYYNENGELSYDDFYDINEGLLDDLPPYTNAPTYFELINWVFSYLMKLVKDDTKYNEDKLNQTQDNLNLQLSVDWLEFWYNQLKECPLNYEFKGRLLKWFEDNNYYLFSNSLHQLNDSHFKFRFTIHENITQLVYLLVNEKTTHEITKETLKEQSNFDTRKEAEDRGILEIFKMLRNENK